MVCLCIPLPAKLNPAVLVLPGDFQCYSNHPPWVRIYPKPGSGYPQQHACFQRSTTWRKGEQQLCASAPRIRVCSFIPFPGHLCSLDKLLTCSVSTSFFLSDLMQSKLLLTMATLRLITLSLYTSVAHSIPWLIIYIARGLKGK